jgi:hypothetical protein
MNRLRPTALIACLHGALLACASEEAPVASDGMFTDITEAAGIDFRYTFGDDQFSFILEDTGSGCAVIDADGDGWMDLYLVNGCYLEGVSDPAFAERNADATNRLYRNRQDGTFEDVTDAAGVGDRGYGMGAIVGDPDADGDEDLYVLNYGPDVYYRNRGDGTFEEATEEVGLSGPDELNGMLPWSVNGQFLDFDRDGDLDLYVAHYLAFDPTFVDPNLPEEYPYPGPESYLGQPSLLYRNEGDGSFVDVTAAVGLWQDDSKTMGAAFADLDNDGDVDVFEAADDAGNLLFRQNEDGTFTEVGVAASVAFDRNGKQMASMHASIGDMDADGLLDVFVPDLEAGCLYRNLGDLQFEEVGAERGLADALRGSGGWGSAFEDFDNDGDRDLLVVLGGAFSLEAGEADRLFLNDGRLAEGLGAYFSERHVSRGAAFADFDNDGDIDFAVSRKDVEGSPHLIRNDLQSGNHWITVELSDPQGTRGLGGRVEVATDGSVQVREVMRATSYLSSCDPRVHFGLGSSTKVRIRVRWANGKVTKRNDVDVDQIVVITPAK